jgi:hypothetical protein
MNINISDFFNEFKNEIKSENPNFNKITFSNLKKEPVLFLKTET